MKSTRQISVIAVMTATCVATNYLLIGFVNIKFMDLIVFVSGLTFGAVVGSSIGALTWFVYGTLNPYGFSLPILFATSLSETIYGIVGGLLGRQGMLDNASLGRNRILIEGLKFAAVGFLVTFVYDLLTNVATAYSLGLPLIPVLVAGILFSLVHEVSNATLFFFGVVPLLSLIRKLPDSYLKRGMKSI
jgi:uncharacterized membrane protein